MDYLDAWYEHLDVEETLDRKTTGSKRSRVLRGGGMKALLKDNDAAAAKLCRYERQAQVQINRPSWCRSISWMITPTWMRCRHV